MKGPKKPEFSIIIPAYNASLFIGEALESVLTQSVEDLEILVIDDGSTDDTALQVERTRDDRIRLMRTPNHGVSAARNLGLDHARGTVVTFLDADDRWRPGKLETERDLLSRHPDVGVTFCNFERFDNGTGEYFGDQFRFYRGLSQIPSSPANPGGCRLLDSDAFEALVGLGEFPVFTQMMAFRAEVVRGLRFRRLRRNPAGVIVFLEDLHFCMRAFLRAQVAYIPTPLADMRRHGANTTTDYKSLVVGKLLTLMTLRRESLTLAQREALDARIARAWIAVGRYLARSGRPCQAGACYWKAAVAGLPRTAASNAIRLPVHVLKGKNRAST